MTAAAESTKVGPTPEEQADGAGQETGGSSSAVQLDDEEPRGARLMCCAPEKTVGRACVKLGVCFLAGIVFGLALEKGRVFEPEVIRGQMVFERWIMVKMFLTAMVVGQFILALLSVLPFQWTHVMFGFCTYNFTTSLEDKSIFTSIVGPFILGVGMTLSGACPGTVLAQVGSWTKNSIYTFVGALVGAFVYGFVAPVLVAKTKRKKPYDFPTMYEKFGVSYWMLALPCAIVLLGGVVALEWFVPWETDLPSYNRNFYNVTMNPIFWKSWPPSVAGALIGLMQLFIVVTIGDTLGSSRGYMTLVSQWAAPRKLRTIFPHFDKFRCGLINWWQVIYVLAAIAGSCLSSITSGSLGTTRGVDLYMTFGGGFFMLFGARFSSGCTSEHGLSGAGLLYWLSFIAVPAMFGGAICTGYGLRYLGLLDQYDCYGPCHQGNTTTPI